MAQQHINYSTPNDGLGDTLRTSQVKAESNFNELYSNKVDKIDGKELSDNNFSDADKTKLDALDPDAGTQSDWNEGNPLSPAFIENKPENTSDFFNDGDGVQSFVTDTGEVGLFVRSQGEWKSIMPKIFDGIIGVTAGLAVGQTTFTLPDGAKCVDVWLSHAKQYKTTANNASLVNRWSQSGNNVTITKSPILNNYLYIEYL